MLCKCMRCVSHILCVSKCAHAPTFMLETSSQKQQLGWRLQQSRGEACYMECPEWNLGRLGAKQTSFPLCYCQSKH